MLFSHMLKLAAVETVQIKNLYATVKNENQNSALEWTRCKYLVFALEPINTDFTV